MRFSWFYPIARLGIPHFACWDLFGPIRLVRLRPTDVTGEKELPLYPHQDFPDSRIPSDHWAQSASIAADQESTQRIYPCRSEPKACLYSLRRVNFQGGNASD